MPDSSLLKKYQKALSNAGMGYWEFDAKSNIMNWDEGFRRLYDFKEGCYKGTVEDVMQKVHKTDHQSVLQYGKAIMSDKVEMNTLFRIATRNNKIRYVRSRAYKIKKDGKLVALVGINWDVTNEFVLQREVKKAKEFTEKVLNAIPDPIFVKNQKHEWIYANTEFEKLLGMKREKFIGKSDYEFFPKEYADIYWEKDQEVFSSNRSNENEEKVVDGQGRDRDILTRKTPLNLSAKEKILVGVIRDITDEKKIQASLVEQSKMASLGEMAAGIAHEINNPLTIIQGKSQLLQGKIANKQIDPDACKKDLELIEQNCVRIDKIIKSLKSVSRKADLDPFEGVSVLGLIDEAFEISKERFRKKKLNLFVITDEFIDYKYHTKARPSEIVQVLVNLLNNSYDAIQNQPNGWARINLTCVENKFFIEVTDSGPEIKPEVAQRMMEPFFTTKSTGKGTGLGLSVSKQIIQNHNGDLYYDDKNANTCFVFTLPKA